jgi:glutaredoxin
MKKLLMLFPLIFSIYSMTTSAAVNVVECEDASGNRSFQKACPPGWTLLNEKKILTGGKGEKREYTSDYKIKKSATLYTGPNCDACDEVREFLNENEVSITEIDVSNDYEVQVEFEKIAGDLRVPVTIIDDNLIRGYKRSEFKAALELNDEPEKKNEGEEAEEKPE